MRGNVGFRLLHTAFLIGTALLLAGCAEAEPVKPEPPKVTVQHPQVRQLTEYAEFNGWMDASDTVEVRARVRGHIDKIHFVDGEIVEAGKLLFELDPRPFQSEVDRSKEQLRIAEAQAEVSTKDEERAKQLFEKKAISLAELEKTVAVRKSWDAQVTAAKEEIKRRELELSYSKITAPIAGRVGRAMLTQGNLVNAGGSDPLLTTIVQANPIQVYFSVDERTLLRYRERRRAEQGELKEVAKEEIPFEFGLEEETGYPHPGVIDFTGNKIDATTGTIEVRGTCDNADGKFLPGGRVRVRVAVGDPYEAVLVPDLAILSDQDKKYVLCVNDEKVVVRRDVKPGNLQEDGMREVMPPAPDAPKLGTSDLIIVLGLQRARVNDQVVPVDADAREVASVD